MTAVEWLEEQFEESYSYINEIFKETIEQAKEMEKQQIIDAWIATDNELQRLAVETYYNETYKKETK
jgi:uncharacterized protein YjgD (DUF1641 family)